MKIEVTLQFPSLRAIYLFCAAARLDNFELNRRTFLLTCTCCKEDISLAVIRYGAKLVSEQGARKGKVQS